MNFVFLPYKCGRIILYIVFYPARGYFTRQAVKQIVRRFSKEGSTCQNMTNQSVYY